MRELTSHIVKAKVHCNEIVALDEKGDGGANHQYQVTITGHPLRAKFIKFQNGPINDDNPPNGLQNEDLLAILIDRMEGFQSGKFACEENELALFHLEAAMEALQTRTRDRVAREVEGSHEL